MRNVIIRSCECPIQDHAKDGDEVPCGMPAYAIIDWGEEPYEMFVCEDHYQKYQESNERALKLV